ncbi:hypothetical protein BKA62DRAFT_782877 [Auriculariales sp. MPI-PUGE-AT-0066]|nr:hypothetical protein BKA62DRAFT_782877 [Auriculariales sp. MPI-PUGE-AT-0066]
MGAIVTLLLSLFTSPPIINRSRNPRIQLYAPWHYASHIEAGQANSHISQQYQDYSPRVPHNAYTTRSRPKEIVRPHRQAHCGFGIKIVRSPNRTWRAVEIPLTSESPHSALQRRHIDLWVSDVDVIHDSHFQPSDRGSSSSRRDAAARQPEDRLLAHSRENLRFAHAPSGNAVLHHDAQLHPKYRAACPARPSTQTPKLESRPAPQCQAAIKSPISTERQATDSRRGHEFTVRPTLRQAVHPPARHGHASCASSHGGHGEDKSPTHDELRLRFLTLRECQEERLRKGGYLPMPSQAVVASRASTPSDTSSDESTKSKCNSWTTSGSCSDNNSSTTTLASTCSSHSPKTILVSALSSPTTRAKSKKRQGRVHWVDDIVWQQQVGAEAAREATQKREDAVVLDALEEEFPGLGDALREYSKSREAKKVDRDGRRASRRLRRMAARIVREAAAAGSELIVPVLNSVSDGSSFYIPAVVPPQLCLYSSIRR